MLQEVQALEWPRNRFNCVGESWDCSRVERRALKKEDGFVMHAEIMKQWEQATTVKRSQGGKPQYEKVRSATELVVVQTHMPKM